MVDYWKDRPVHGAKARVPVIAHQRPRPAVAGAGHAARETRRSGVVRSQARLPAGAARDRPRSSSTSPGRSNSGRAFWRRSCAARTANRCTASATSRSSTPETAVLHPETGHGILDATPRHTSRRMPWTATPARIGPPSSRTVRGSRWTSARRRRSAACRSNGKLPSRKSFSVQVSTDGKNWTDVYRTDDGKGGVSEIKFAPVEARHVRLVCTKRGTQWGNAVCEMEVFEK